MVNGAHGALPSRCPETPLDVRRRTEDGRRERGACADTRRRRRDSTVRPVGPAALGCAFSMVPLQVRLVRQSAQHLLHAIAQGARRIPPDAIVDPLADLFAFDQPRLTQEAQVVRNGGLLDRNGRLEVADADATFVAGEHVEQLQPHRVGELFQVRGESPSASPYVRLGRALTSQQRSPNWRSTISSVLGTTTG